ncbi:S-adenosyl-L-methionine-dependent methyltransferase [Flagelloscypha sp. PMI_526]|nr:S-adenosyl-L-methionine-dependent methyltransferase [Flagelloscypha sp. PMI_526]
MDEAIRQTDSDASGSRFCAVQKGYLNDPYASLLVQRPHLIQPRPPLINIGTYLRSSALDGLIFQFMDIAASENKKCQIISFGAGSDTRFWRIESSDRQSTLSHYWEFDFAEITTKKAMAIKKHMSLNSLLGDPSQISLSHGGTCLHSPKYQLLSLDMRQSLDALLKPVTLPGLSFPINSYTRFYKSNAILQWFANHFTGPGATLAGVVYEMFMLNDPFGRVMLNNMKARNVPLPGVVPYTSKASLPSRFINRGFSWAKALDLHEIRLKYVPQEESDRISTLEMLDEIEEMDLVLRHYAITWSLLQTDPSEYWYRWGLPPRD